MTDTFWKKVSYYFGLLPIAAIFGLAAYVATMEIRDLDLWLHLGTGRYILLHKFVPNFDILSCTIPGQPWINHEWLFQILVYGIFNNFGPEGLINMQMGLVVVTMLFLLFLGYNRDNQILIAILLFCVFSIYQQRFTFRPDLFSLFFFTIYIFVLSLHIDKKWALPVLFVTQVLWVNMHGFFFFGPLFAMIGLISEWIKRHVALPFEWNEAGRLTDQEYRRLKIIFAAVLLACLFNPEGFKGAWYPIGVFFSLGGENKIFFDHIQELQKPITRETLFSIGHNLYYKIFIFFSAVSFYLNRRRIDISALLFWLVFLVFSLKAMRNMPYFAFASYLVIITNLVNISLRDIAPFNFTNKKIQHINSAVIKILLLAWIMQFSYGAGLRGYYDFEKYEIKSEYGGISQRSYPHKAVQFMKDKNIKGNFFNDFNSGAYLVGNMHPDIKVFIDGRTEVYGGEFFKQYMDIWNDGKTEKLTPLIERHHITGALLNASRQPLPKGILNYFYKNPDWVCIYFDHDALIFLKHSPENARIIGTNRIDLAHWQAKTLDLFKFGAILEAPFENYSRALTLEALELDQPAIAEAKAALSVVPSYAEPYEILGRIYAKNHDYEKAFENFRIVVMYKPNKKEMRYNLANAYLELEQYEGAAKEYERIMARWPTEAKAFFLLAKTHTINKDYPKAMKALEKAHTVNSKDTMDILAIGDIALGVKAYPHALDIYQFAFKTNERRQEVHKRIGLLYKDMGNPSKAKEHFGEALKLAPNDEEIKKLAAE